MLISWINHIDSATVSQDSGFGDTTPLSVQNVKTRQLGDKWRTIFSNTVSPQTSQLVSINADLGAAKDINFVALLGHNFPTTTANSSNEPWLGIKLSNIGTSSAEVLNTGSTPDFNVGTNDAGHWFVPLAQTYSARYVNLEIRLYDGTYGPTVLDFLNGTWDIGRVWVGSAWQPTCSMSFEHGVVDDTGVFLARDGSEYVKPGSRRRAIKCKAIGTTDADFFGTASAPDDCFVAMDQAVGTSGEVIVLPSTSNTREIHRLGVHGHISQNGPIRVIDRASGGLVTEKQFIVEEEK